MKRTLLIGLSITLFAMQSAAATGPSELLKTKLEVLRKLAAQAKPHDAIRTDLKKEMDTFFDYTTLGNDVMKGLLKKQTAEHQNKYHQLFKRMIQRVYLKKYKPGTAFTNAFGKETLNGATAVVKTQVRYKRSVADVVYYLAQRGGKWWVVDVELDDLSLMRSYRKRFRRVVKAKGFAILLEKMQRAAAKK